LELPLALACLLACCWVSVTMMSEHADSEKHNVPSLKRIGAATLGLLSGHVELLGVELEEQKICALRTLFWTALIIVAGLLLIIGLSLLVLVSLWDEYRLQAIIGLCFFYTYALLLGVWRLRVTLKAAADPFNATREELARNRDRLLSKG